MKKKTRSRTHASSSRGLLLAAPLAVLMAVGFAPTPQTPKVGDQAAFDKEVAPLLNQYCTPCHSAESPAGNINLAKYKTVAEIQKDQTVWRKVVTRVRERSMPPKGATQPEMEKRERLAAWLTGTLDSADDSLIPKDPGRVLIHRLNRQEYNNTVRDLLGVTSNPADAFPADGGGGGGFDNNADTLYIPPILMERYLDAADRVLTEAKPERLFVVRPGLGVRPGQGVTPEVAARRTLEYQAFRAFRRPVEPAEITRLMALYQRAAKRGDGYEASVRLAMKAILVSPSFLFRLEAEKPTKDSYPISDFELASRLSYFLWCSMPDDQLLTLAKQGKLHDPKALEQQVRRMRESPKFMAFADSFAGQWLRIRELYTTAQPDTGRFPEYTPELRDSLYQETVQFFASVLREDAPLTTLIDARYSFLNEDLAKHYGIPGVTGKELRRVPLPDGRRGGLLTMGSVLTLSSYPQRSSPVLRGKWMLSEFFGTPPPPPPPVVATLPPDDSVSKEGLTFRQRLEQHRSKPECATCHSRIDPLGFGLENYDAIGRWRDKIANVAVDASGTLPSGESFTGPIELKAVVLKRKEDFLHNLVEKMLAYALGRGLQPTDLPTVKHILAALDANNDRATTLLLEVVKSYPFQNRKNG